MATREDIEQPLTLEFGGEVSPAEFERLVAAFFDVVEGVELPGEKMQWAVQVKKGSQLVGVAPITAPHQAAMLAQAIADGVALLERRAEKPEGFSDNALRGLRVIAKADTSPAAPRIWTDFVPHHVTIRVAANVGELLEGKVVEYGSISGKLETVSERKSFRFIIYDDLWDHPINCLFKEEDKVRVMGAFGKRVEVFGDIRYRNDGRATSVEVKDFTEFPDPDTLPKTADVRGILKNYRRDVDG
jgi:hypothetical protein